MAVSKEKTLKDILLNECLQEYLFANKLGICYRPLNLSLNEPARQVTLHFEYAEGSRKGEQDSGNLADHFNDVELLKLVPASPSPIASRLQQSATRQMLALTFHASSPQI